MISTYDRLCATVEVSLTTVMPKVSPIKYFVDEVDERANSLGAKGIGELGAVGVAPAIANAVYHATVMRVRSLPITVEKLL